MKQVKISRVQSKTSASLLVFPACLGGGTLWATNPLQVLFLCFEQEGGSTVFNKLIIPECLCASTVITSLLLNPNFKCSFTRCHIEDMLSDKGRWMILIIQQLFWCDLIYYISRLFKIFFHHQSSFQKKNKNQWLYSWLYLLNYDISTLAKCGIFGVDFFWMKNLRNFSLKTHNEN